MHFQNTKIFESLLAAGADPSLAEETCRAFKMAAQCVDVGILQRLLDAGADINLLDGNDSTAPSTTAHLNRTDIVNLLIQHGAAVPETTVLHVACKPLLIKIFELFLATGINTRILGLKGYTPLIRTAEHGNLAMTDMLLRLPEIDVKHINHKDGD